METSKIASSTDTSTPTTTNDIRPLSVDQLTDVRDTLKGPPLTNRSVLIPFGRKAFLPGRLLPLILQKDDQKDPFIRSNTVSDGTAKSRGDENAKEHEIVLVHNIVVYDDNDTTSTESINNKSVQMTRQEALNYLQNEIDTLKKHSSKSQTQTGRTNTTLSSNATNTGSRTPTPVTTTTATTTTATAATGSDLPFIEIREELDDTGNVITGKAINVTKHLNFLSQQQQQQQQDEEDEATVKNRQNDHSMNDTEEEEMKTAQTHPLNENTVPAISENTHSTTVTPLQPHPTKITEEQYDLISRRLDELMLLEEQQDQKHNMIPTIPLKTTKTSKSSKNKGWAKGFLNSPKPSKTLPATTAKPKIIPHHHPTTHALSSSPSNNKKVSFTGQDDVQEIPRIGQRSITSLQQQSSSLMLPTNHTMAPIPSDNPNRVIASQVIEKKQTHRRRSTNVSKIETNVQSSSSMGDNDHNNNASSHSEPTKKLSRFAQERQQMLK